MPEFALLLAHGLYATEYGKTSHGLVRGPSRWPLAGVVDPTTAGRDAGEVLDGRHRGIPVFASLHEAFRQVGAPLTHAVIGIATEGGVLPADLRPDLLEAAGRGLTVVSGLHRLLEDDPEILKAARAGGARLVELRKPRPVRDLRFWTGEVRELAVPRIAVLGTDCAVGKRTTAVIVRDGCREAGLRAEMVYTGQTGWLQGMEHGFILDATANDFVCGELERAILECAREKEPDLILLEGQSALRNPSGPCGAELILGGAAAGVLLQHDPGRRTFEGTPFPIPPLEEEIELIRLLGCDVWAVTLNHSHVPGDEAERIRAEIEDRLALPVVLPLRGGAGSLVEIVRSRMGEIAS